LVSSVLNQEQISRIHGASLEILERVGVHLPHPEVLSRFADSGARVDWSSARVWIPESLVARCLGSAGKSFTLYGRDVAHTAAFGQGQRNYNSVAGEALWVETPGSERRYPTLEDVATASRLGDALDAINVVGAMADPQGVSVSCRCVEVLATQVRNTTKPVHFWYHDRASARYINEILIAVRGGAAEATAQPLCYPFLEPISPLRFPFNGVDLLFETARLNLPVPIGPMAQMGLSAPATLAGTMAQENAEILAGLCITQLIRPGMPVCYGGICHAFDMRTTQLIFSGPEQAIFGVAMTQMGKHYGLPVYINVGLTDSKRPDAQAGLESGVTLALGAAAGADIFGHMGISGVDQAASLDMLVLHNEVIRYVESTLRPIEVSDEMLGLDEVEAAGPGGSFLDRDHTVRHFRKELWFPRLLDRDYYDAWRSSGAVDTAQRCAEWKARLLSTHRPEPVAPDLDRALTDIVTSAQRELTKAE
jgi:trimethylamine--corrinoid protein Co-methyltransferase